MRFFGKRQDDILEIVGIVNSAVVRIEATTDTDRSAIRAIIREELQAALAPIITRLDRGNTAPLPATFIDYAIHLSDVDGAIRIESRMLPDWPWTR